MIMVDLPEIVTVLDRTLSNIASVSTTPKAFANCSPGQRPGIGRGRTRKNSERVRRQLINPRQTPVGCRRLRTPSEFAEKIRVVPQGVALGCNLRTPSALRSFKFMKPDQDASRYPIRLILSPVSSLPNWSEMDY